MSSESLYKLQGRLRQRLKTYNAPVVTQAVEWEPTKLLANDPAHAAVRP